MICIKIINTVEGLAQAGYNLQDETGEGINLLGERVSQLFNDNMGWDYSYPTKMLRIILASDNHLESELREQCAEFGEVVSIGNTLW